VERFIPQDAGRSALDRAGGSMAAQVDVFVLTVTESLCMFDKQCRSVMERPENRERKARILAALQALDRMMADIRGNLCDLSDVELSLPAGPDRERREP